MKSNLFFVMLVVQCCFIPVLTVAQSDMPKGQLLAVHEDFVMPSMVAQYEKAAKNLADLFAKHGITSSSYTAASRSDFTYIYFTPVDNLAAVDKMGGGFDELKKKMGDAAYDAAMKQFDNCYPTHRNYMVRLRPDLSYKPEYGSQMSDGMNFRHWDFYFIHPGMEVEAEKIAKEWIALNESKKIVEGYRLYVGAMGTDMPVFVVTQSAKDAADYYTKSEASGKTLGDAGKALMNRTWTVVRKFESVDGHIRPDLSVQPKNITTK